jgi:dimethylargininase
MTAPATLDGGDCMRVGRSIFVGRSARTNAAGIARLAEVFEPHGYRVISIDMPSDVLHLKCVCAPLPDGRITLADATIPRAAFGYVEVVTIPAEEAYAANVLALPDRVLIPDGFPRARAAIEAAGFTVHALATTEFRKADGALTCLSVLVDT